MKNGILLLVASVITISLTGCGKPEQKIALEEKASRFLQIPPVISEKLDKERSNPSLLFKDIIKDIDKDFPPSNNMADEVVRGQVYAQTMQFEKAIHCYIAAAKLDPQAADPFIGLGKVYYTLASNDYIGAVMKVDQPDLSKTKKIFLLAKEVLEYSRGLSRTIKKSDDGTALIGFFDLDEPEATLKKINLVLSGPTLSPIQVQ